MISQIDLLTPEQAQRAVLLFHDLLPDAMWEGHTKPSTTRMEILNERLLENLPVEMKPILREILTEENNEYRGLVAKHLLQSFGRNNGLRPYVELAISGAVKLHMAPIPMDIGTILIFMGLLSLDIDFEYKGVKLSIRGKAPELVEKFTEFVKAVPERLLAGVT